MKLNSSLVLLALAMALGCESGPSNLRLSSIEYTPDNTSSPKEEFVFSYFESGFLDKVEFEVDGDEQWTETFWFDDATKGLTRKVREFEDVNNTISDASFEWANGRIETVVETTSAKRVEEGDFEGTSTFTATGERVADYKFDDAGNIESVDATTDLTQTNTFESEFGDSRSSSRTSVGTMTENTFGSDGLLKSRLVTTDREYVTSQGDRDDDSDDFRTRTSSENESNLRYTDGILNSIETENVARDGDDRERSESELTFDYDTDGKVADIETETRIDSERYEDRYRIDYDDEGRIIEIKDRDGNSWEYNYVEGQTVSGVTLSTGILGEMVDLEGNLTLDAMDLPTHLSYQ